MRALVYGATGYTGRLIVRRAAEHGIRPVVAGRDAAAVAELGREHGLEHRVFGLDGDAAAVEHGLAGIAVLLNCAGPFVHTWRPLAEACLNTRTHYVDITGEVEVFEALAALDAQARGAGVMLLPGAGFDVVPSDCVAARLARRLPDAARLVLAIRGSGPLSHGTAATAVEHQDRGGLVRRAGRLTRVPAGWRTRSVDFGDGRLRTAVSIPWGDLATAWRSTGIENIEVYAAVPRRLVTAIRLSRHLQWLLRRPAVRSVQRRILRARPAGPSGHELRHGTSAVWGMAEAANGEAVAALLRGPNGYTLTADAALAILHRVLDGRFEPGFRTPSLAYGEGLAAELPGVSLYDVDPPHVTMRGDAAARAVAGERK
jgi:short subunit dehydrogenase-like uncharacterized protein